MKSIKKTIPFPKILAVDLDGTLLRSDHTVSDRTVEAFHRIREKGCLPVISTGRSYEALSAINERLGLDSPIICYNGAMTCDSSGLVLHELRLDSDIARDVLHTCRERGIHFQGFHEGQLYYEKHNPITDFYEKHTGLTGKAVNFDEWESLDFTKVLLIGPPDRPSQSWPELDRIQKEVSERFGERIYTAFSRIMYLEMINGASSKGHALKQLGIDLGASREEIAAFGDGFNDAEMLDYAGISVAMGNAPEELKKMTAYTTISNDEDGIAHFIETHFL